MYGQNLGVVELVGKTFDKVVNKNDGEIVFYQGDKEVYKMLHFQDCCENVVVEDIDADLDVLESAEILEAYESTKNGSSEDSYDSSTWTFYKFRTEKGWITIRWFGESNGYYSESVDLIKV